jgi:drug/metabolite transporter (DMT)-like permease
VAYPSDATLQVIALALLSAAGFGAALVTTHSGLKHMDASSGAKVSIPTATLLFWLLSPFVDLAGWQAAAIGIFALVGLFFPAAVTLLTFEGNRRLGPTVAGTIGSTTPLFAVLGAALFLGEAPGAREFAATAIIVLGTMALSKPAAGEMPGASRSALWMPWSAALLRALAQVLSKAGLALWPSPFAAALVGYSVSAAIVWTAGLFASGNGAPVFTRRGAAWFALTGVLNGAAVLSMYHALTTGPVQVVAPVVAIYPLFTLALSTTLLRYERLNARLIGGVVLTVAGVVILLAR